MKRYITLALMTLAAVTTQAQEFGLSFSYFIPKNGYFSTPISPFSIRGLGFDFNRYLALEAGASLYRMSGLNMKDLPFESKDPLVGPNFTIFVPVELVIQFHGQKADFDIKGGAFGFHGFSQRINYGNFDRALRKAEGWEVVNSDFTFKNKPGWGYHGGAELTLYVTNDVGVSLEANYLVGESRFPLKGSYTGGNTTLETRTVEYADAKIDFTGWEFSVGLIFSSGNSGPSAPKKAMKRKRRRR
ncbi:hypothetical protein [Dawidia soli]|uniref:Outer membrane protein beta-barrel domain-containing protein n=1 Tax=Dawidia soli TaxID=2782352 RepID=A0AAP2DCC2_9BACT|nr:hypothetical protein [Dawidia soli]MBT1688481.1 hypothetical protein [Dawidia soli]